jgi:predicted helicase
MFVELWAESKATPRLFERRLKDKIKEALQPLANLMDDDVINGEGFQRVMTIDDKGWGPKCLEI